MMNLIIFLKSYWYRDISCNEFPRRWRVFLPAIALSDEVRNRFINGASCPALPVRLRIRFFVSE